GAPFPNVKLLPCNFKTHEPPVYACKSSFYLILRKRILLIRACDHKNKETIVFVLANRRAGFVGFHPINWFAFITRTH
ncbi:MAG: hypothetical protein MJA30_34930, partial [Cytophagales bacterium]|nr:hypothetical protein [Cytophagales bacterium]